MVVSPFSLLMIRGFLNEVAKINILISVANEF
jgi:hypothetical protein